jgi:hypothetical protein
MVPLSLKATVPPSGVGETVAVKVTDCPKAEGLSEEVTPVVVAARFTCWFGESVPVEEA